MYDTSSDITALISARICHDLASPLGAIANGMELLELAGKAESPEAALLADSVASATARMAFIRVAYGAASANSVINPSQAQKILAGNFADKKIKTHWAISQDCPKSMVKLLFLLMQSAETALPYGGVVHLCQKEQCYEIHAEAKSVRIEPALWESLSQSTAGADLSSARIHFELARQQGMRLSQQIGIQSSDTTLDITIKETPTG